MNLSLSHILTAVFFILLGITWLGWVAITQTFLGVWSLVTGIVWLVEGYHPVTVWHRPNPQ